MQANFGVVTRYVNNDIFGQLINGKQAMGSAVVFKRIQVNPTTTKYFLLTNNHTVAPQDGYEEITYEITDYKGNTYRPTLLCALKEYDLAVLTFFADNEDSVYIPLEIAPQNVAIRAQVASIGRPMGQINALTLGRAVEYSTVKPDENTVDLSNVLFEVLYHDAPINTGSSGGAVLDETNRIVGINFAMTYGEETGVVYGCAVPAEKIREFLSAHDL